MVLLLHGNVELQKLFSFSSKTVKLNLGTNSTKISSPMLDKKQGDDCKEKSCYSQSIINFKNILRQSSNLRFPHQHQHVFLFSIAFILLVSKAQPAYTINLYENRCCSYSQTTELFVGWKRQPKEITIFACVQIYWTLRVCTFIFYAANFYNFNGIINNSFDASEK